MARDQDVGIHRAQRLVGVEGILRARVVFRIAGDRSGRATENDLIVPAVFLGVDEVGRSAERMAGRPDHLDRGPSERDVISALQDPAHLDRLLAPGLVGRQVVAADKRGDLRLECRHRRSRDAANGLHRLHVVEVRVGDQHQLDVPRLETELDDVGEHDGRHLLRAGVEQDVALRGGDQDRRDVVGADVVDVAHDLERGLRLAVGIRASDAVHEPRGVLAADRERIGRLRLLGSARGGDRSQRDDRQGQ